MPHTEEMGVYNGIDPDKADLTEAEAIEYILQGLDPIWRARAKKREIIAALTSSSRPRDWKSIDIPSEQLR